MIEENKNLYVSYWLLLITLLVALMIIIGGLTRLTESGLSITKWDLFTGILPPLNLMHWEEQFQLYKQIPEYKLLNHSMTLNEFKVIFWWEYIHRLLGRIIGLLYIIPLIFFTYKKKIIKNSFLEFYLIFIIILLQGFIGWYMVKSGLTKSTDVSQYRLSIHLTIAFIIFILLLWNFLKYQNFINLKQKDIELPYNLALILLVLIIVQISIGAFVSGLNSAQVYQTWPLMDLRYFPDDSNFIDLLSLKIFESPSLIQFIHRNIAYLIFILSIFITYVVFKNKKFKYLRTITVYVFISVLIQILLGISTIVSGAQIILATMHQMGSILLITTSLILVFKSSRIN